MAIFPHTVSQSLPEGKPRQSRWVSPIEASQGSSLVPRGGSRCHRYHGHAGGAAAQRNPRVDGVAELPHGW